jgi:hypothetical protein
VPEPRARAERTLDLLALGQPEGQGGSSATKAANSPFAAAVGLVAQGKAAPGLLDSYSAKRSAIGEHVLRSTGRMTRIALLHNPLLRELRDLAAGSLSRLPAIQQRLVDQLTELDLHYAHSPLNETPHGAARHPASGARAPDVVLGGSRLHALLGGYGFVLLSVGVASPAVPQPLQTLVTPAQTDHAEGYDLGHHYLVRPDSYLALSTPGDDATPAFDALQRLSAPTPC